MSETQTPAGKWISYRAEIKLVDCTIRDGGLMNDHKFDDAVVKGVYDACVAAGIDYMEIGYRNSKVIFPEKENGPWKYSSEEDIRRIVGDNDTPLKLAVMADAEKSDYERGYTAGRSTCGGHDSCRLLYPPDSACARYDQRRP